MMTTRRGLMQMAASTAVTGLVAPAFGQATGGLKISHQFPSGTLTEGDFRDRLTRMFAAEVSKRSGGEILADVYPNSSLVKTNAQFGALRKGGIAALAGAPP